MAFAHLHVHSQFSILNGVPRPKELVGLAKNAGMDALALTDTCNLYGAVEFFKACKEKQIHPAFGAEIWLDTQGIANREGKLDAAFQLVLLVEDEVGYKNLCELITRAIYDGIYYRPRIDWELLQTHAQGLICLGGGEMGVLRRPGLVGRDEGESRLLRLGDLFGPDRLFLELMDHGLPWQPQANVEARAMAAKLGLRTVVTNDVRYKAPMDAVGLDVLNCIGLGASLNDPKRPRPQTDQCYFKTEAEMRELFPDDGDAIELSAEIAHRAHYKFPGGIYYFPASKPPDVDQDTEQNWAFFYNAFPPPVAYGLTERPAKPPEAGTLNGFFRWYARQGLEGRLKYVDPALHKEYRDRTELELTMIIKMGFAAYLLIVAEFINWAKDRAIPVGPGRGSAAGSAVAWAMRITDIDPMRFVLLFERFLNPERISMPDIDVDFAQDRREEVIEHVREKYTPPFVSQIITYGKLQAKAALKDVARVCDINFQESDRITKLVPERLNISIKEALAEEPRMTALRDSDPKVRRVITMALAIEGITRQTGVHAAGVVIADRPLVQLAPLYKDSPEGGPVVQYDMKSAESIGLIKFDFLGLKTLDQVRDAVDMVERNTGEHIDIAHIPDDDVVTWNLLKKGDALGVFQVESSGMRELLTRLRPSCLEDLVALVALYRPGPLSSGMVDDFIDRKHGKKAVEYPFAELEPILKSTYGTIVYQEQVMQVAQVLAGYSLGEADLLRRAMGKKDAAEMAKQKTRFVGGAIKAGHDETRASDLFDLLAKFAEYGFNKSHSAAYGFVAYQTAWLKANHRAEYMASLMSIDAGNSDKILVYIGDCRKAGIKILPPDINESIGPFNVPRTDRRSIRYGLNAIKGIGESAVEHMVEEREKKGPYRDFLDLLTRCDFRRINKKVLEGLVKSGALDSFGEPRARMLSALEAAMQAAQQQQALAAAGQVGLFAGASSRPTFKMPNVSEWTIGERMRNEKEALGFFLTGHPAEDFRNEVDRFGFVGIDQLNHRDDQSEVAVCGVVALKKLIKTKKGDPMAFVTLEDIHGQVECVFFTRALEKCRAALDAGRPILVRGKLERKEDGNKILAEAAELMEDIRERRTTRIKVKAVIDQLNDDTLLALHAIFEKNRGDCASKLVVTDPARRYIATLTVQPGKGVRATPKFHEAITSLLGADAVEYA